MVIGLAAGLLYRVFCQRIRSVQSGSVHIHFNDWGERTSNEFAAGQAAQMLPHTTQMRYYWSSNNNFKYLLLICLFHWKYLSEIFFSIGICDLPGLRKPVAGAHSHSRKTVDHFFYCGLVRKVEHDWCCEQWETSHNDRGNGKKNSDFQILSYNWHLTYFCWPWRPPLLCSVGGSVWRRQPGSHWTSTFHVSPQCMLRP